MPCSKAHCMLTKLPQHATSILTQLHTGHVALCMFLKKIKAVNSALFPHCSKPKSVSNYLLYCNKFADIHCQFRFEVGIAAMSLHRLLSQETVILHTLKYVARSKCFK